MSQLKQLTATDFEDAISGDSPVLVDFWAEWCGPCKMVAPILEDIANENDAITVAKLNIDDHPGPASQFDVMSIPTMIVFQNGVEKKRIVGARPKASIMSELAEFI